MHYLKHTHQQYRLQCHEGNHWSDRAGKNLWGADPHTLLTLFKGNVHRHLDWKWVTFTMHQSNTQKSRFNPTSGAGIFTRLLENDASLSLNGRGRGKTLSRSKTFCTDEQQRACNRASGETNRSPSLSVCFKTVIH